MTTDKIFVVDTWEGGGEIDEELLKNSGVSGMFVRINGIDGGLHLDSGFEAQWKQAKTLPVRIAYFVYNPWRSGEENYKFLMSVLPPECGAILPDIEVKYSGISRDKYAADVALFVQLCKQSGLNVMIYTGEWFLDNLSYWPKNVLYWWAAYPNKFYSSRAETWSNLFNDFRSYDKPFNLSKIPGELGAWQFTGDKLLMQGCTKPMDVNVWYGTLRELQEFAQERYVFPPPTTTPDAEVIDYGDGIDELDYPIKTIYGTAVVHVSRVTRAKIRNYFVNPRPFIRRYVPDYVKKYDLDLAINGDGFRSITIAGYAISNGNPYGKLGRESTLYFSPSGDISRTREKNSHLYMAISYPNELIKDGIIQKIDKSPDDVRARSAFGWNKDFSFFVNVDGADYWVKQGLSCQDLADFMKSIGCTDAVLFDSGGSTTKARKYEDDSVSVVGLPYGEDLVQAYGLKMRRVANILGVVMK